MKKTILFMVILCILAVSVSAFSLNWFTSWFTTDPAVLENIKVYPEKVAPGDVLLVNAIVSNPDQVKSIVANIYHEEGFDAVAMQSMGRVGNQGNYEARWIVHHTLNEKWYDVEVILIDKNDDRMTLTSKFLDPQNHPWSELTQIPSPLDAPSTICTQSNGKCGSSSSSCTICEHSCGGSWPVDSGSWYHTQTHSQHTSRNFNCAGNVEIRTGEGLLRLCCK